MFQFNVLTSNTPILINPLICDNNEIIKLIDINQNMKQNLRCKTKYGHANYNNSNLFLTCCRFGHTSTLKWLVETFDNINVHAYNEYGFRESCWNDHLSTSKWLVDTFDNIDVHANNDDAFVGSCANGQLEVAKWLCDIILDIRVNDDNYLKIASDYQRYELIEYICNLSPYYVCEYDGSYSIREYINVKG